MKDLGRGTRVIMQMAAFKSKMIGVYLSALKLNHIFLHWKRAKLSNRRAASLGASLSRPQEIMKGSSSSGLKLPILVKMAPVNVAELVRLLRLKSIDGLTS